MNFHKKALIIGAMTVLLSVGSFVWIVVLNKGVLSVVGPAPFSVRAQGVALKIPETISCAASPCRLKLPAGEYDLSLTKEGYYDETSTVRILRGEISIVEVAFSFVPHLQAVGKYTDFFPLEASEPLEQRFRFEIDPTYAKQRLIYTDPEDQMTSTWAYFNRDLVRPLVFPSPDLKQALVVDRAALEEKLYLIDGMAFKRSYVGTLIGVSEVLWGTFHDNGQEILIRTVASRSGEAWLWLADLDDPSLSAGGESVANSSSGEPSDDEPSTADSSSYQARIVEWPFDLELNDIVWSTEGDLIFLTTKDLSQLEGSNLETPMDAVKALLKGGISKESTAFVVAQYQPGTGQYRVLLEVPVSLGLKTQTAFLMKDPKDADRILVTDGEEVYEIVMHNLLYPN